MNMITKCKSSLHILISEKMNTKGVHPGRLLFFLIILNMVVLYGTTPTHAGWFNISPEGGSITSLAIDPTNTETIIYAGTSGSGVFKSTRGGL